MSGPHALSTPPNFASALRPLNDSTPVVPVSPSISERPVKPADSHASQAVNQPNNIEAIDTSRANKQHAIAPSPAQSPLSAGLRLKTDVVAAQDATTASPKGNYLEAPDSALALGSSSSTAGILARTPSVKAVLSSSAATANSLSPASAFSSPGLGPMAEITPLPSPIISGGSPGPWKRLAPQTGSGSANTVPALGEDVHVPDKDAMNLSTTSSQQRLKPYQGLGRAMPASRQENKAVHAANRSTSEFVPDAVQVLKPRPIVVSGSGAPTHNDPTSPPEPHLKREQYLAVQRGLATHVVAPPTPPHSNRGAEGSDSDSSTPMDDRRLQPLKRPRSEQFDAVRVKDGTRRRWRAVRELGQGTFSKVFLATSQGRMDESRIGENDVYEASAATSSKGSLDTKKLVAVKVVEHGPAGGASEERIECALKRELDIMKSIYHPSLVHLKAFSVEPSRALLVLSYCPGGDMFEIASERHDLLIPPLIQRIFSELVTATRYLHERNIVHRDIKLENVLFNIPADSAIDIKDWQSYPFAVITLIDLGLSREIDPTCPMLNTRCGSEDYASPELLMGQAYDGRQTDAWALGILLYALMEGRLPFDPLPGASEHQKQRTKTAHRIARVDWAWFKYADADGEPGNFGELEGARTVVEGLLKRATRRFTLDRVANEAWVRDGVQVDGGVRFREECDGQQLQ
ncbi:MAG: hypothetical protein M1833_004234 [Piccolia ochrophora]|nr:MAG: hypothetical protein M1833_004234 [Piccolia ochrophora]